MKRMKRNVYVLAMTDAEAEELKKRIGIEYDWMNSLAIQVGKMRRLDQLLLELVRS